MTARFRIRIMGPSSRATALEAVRAAPIGHVAEVRAETRSLQQNSRLWAMLDEVSAQVEWYGRKYPSEAWKDLFTAALNQQEIVPGLEGGIVALGARTSHMSKGQLGDLMTFIEAWGAERGVVFADPVERP